MSQADGTPRRRRARAKGKKIPWGPIALACGIAVLALTLGLYVFGPEPFDDLESLLREQSFQPNPGLAALLQPGDVIQIAEGDGRGGKTLLSRPLIVLRKEDCFPRLQPAEAPFALPARRGRRSASLDLAASQVTRLLPRLDLSGRGTRSYSLEITNPRILSFSKSELSERFSESCLERFERAVEAGDKAEWFGTIVETVVADGLKLNVEWEAGMTAEARAKLTEAARRGLPFPRAKVKTEVDSTETTVLHAEGPVVLGYRYRAMEGVE